MRTNFRAATTAALTCAVAAGALAVTAPTIAGTMTDDTVCGAMTSPVVNAVNPSSTAAMAAASPGTLARARVKGFTTWGGQTMMASRKRAAGLTPTYRLQRHGDQRLTTSKRTYKNLRRSRWAPLGVAFYASATPLSCAQPIAELTRGGIHRYTARSAEIASLKSTGWQQDGVIGYAVAPQDTFTVAVLPDTQTEVITATNNGWQGPQLDVFGNRVSWLIANRAKLNLKWVVETGDFLNWGHTTATQRDDSQYQYAASRWAALDNAGIGSTLTIGNHDASATCTGGSACTSDAREAIRDTSQFNQYFPVSKHVVGGAAFEGKIDNSYQRFSAGGYTWLVLSLEFMPRTEAVDWAKQVVASHPTDNVIVSTHAYIDGSGHIMQGNDGYGANSPQYVFDQLISKYPNIKMVLSGHVGGHPVSSVSTGAAGNTILNLMGDWDAEKTTTGYTRANDNPTRLLTFNTANGQLDSTWYAPYSGKSWPQYTTTATLSLTPPF